jgi:hypothetical protein
MSATSFANVSSFGGGIVNGNASATVPTINPNKTDPDTGLGSNAVDQLSLIAGGVEMVRLTEDTESLISVNFPIIMTEQNTGPTTVAVVALAAPTLTSGISTQQQGHQQIQVPASFV